MKSLQIEDIDIDIEEDVVVTVEDISLNKSEQLLAIPYEGIQGKCLEMLGNGLSPEIVATALGISASYVSQLLTEEAFAHQVTQRRFISLQAAR